MLKLKVQCPFCHRNLLDDDHKINDAPSIALNGKLPSGLGGKTGVIRLSSIYGDYKIETPLVIPHSTIVDFYCPFCHSDLISNRPCEECDGMMVGLELETGGSVFFCAQRGCKKHWLEFEDIEANLKSFYESYKSAFS